MIPIHNLYYMLSYAFQVLNEQGYKNIATEQFQNTAELMAAILEKGIMVQLKRGLAENIFHRRRPYLLCEEKLILLSPSRRNQCYANS